MRADTRPNRKHALGRFAKGDRDNALALSELFAGAQIKRYTCPAPIVDHAFQRDKGIGVGLRINTVFGAVSGILAAHNVFRVQRQHAAEHLVFLFTDRPRLQRCWRFHRHERQNLKQMGNHHIAERTRGFIESGAFAKPQGFRNINLDVIDEVTVPDRLKQTVGKAESQNILRRFFAQKVINAENLIFTEHAVQFGIERAGAFKVGSERFFHNDARFINEAGFFEQHDGRQSGLGRHAQIMHMPALGADGGFSTGDRGFELRRAC